MAIPSRSDLVFYQNTLLDDADWEANFEAFLNWLTDGTADLIFNTLTLTEDLTVGGDVTVTGNVTATNYFGNGSNLTGISASASGVSGLQALASQSLAQKTAITNMNTSKRANIVESFIGNENFTAALQSNYTANQTLISLTLTANNYAPLYTELIAYDTVTGGLYEFQCESLGSDSYPTVTYVCTPINANLTAGSCNIYRTTLTKDSGMRVSRISTSRTGDGLKYQTVATPQVNLETELTAESIDWEIQSTLPTYPLSRTSGDVTTTTFVLTTGTNVSTQFITGDGSGTASSGVFEDRNKCIVHKNINNGNGSLSAVPVSNGGIFTVSSVSYATGELTLTVAEDTSSVISSDYTDKNVTYTCSPLYVIPKVSCVSDTTTAESFVEQTPSIVVCGASSISYSEFPGNLTAVWNMDEPSGNAIDSFGIYSATQNGTVPSITGKVGGGRGVFSNSNNFTWPSGGSNSTVFDTTTFYLSFWLNCPTSSTGTYIFAKHNGSNTGYYFRISSNKINVVYTASNIITSASDVNTATWTHFFYVNRATSGANEIRMFINGAQDAQTTGATWAANTSDLTIGHLGGANAFLGSLDQVIHGRLSGSESWTDLANFAQRLYNGGLGIQVGNTGKNILKGTATAQSGSRLSAKADLLIPVSTGYQNISSILVAPQ